MTQRTEEGSQKRPRCDPPSRPANVAPRALFPLVDQAGNEILGRAHAPTRSPEPPPRNVRGCVHVLRECPIPGCTAGPFPSTSTLVTHLNSAHKDHTVEVSPEVLRQAGAWFCACGRINVAGKRCGSTTCRGVQPPCLPPQPHGMPLTHAATAPETPRSRQSRDTRVCPVFSCGHHTVALTKASLLSHIARLHVSDTPSTQLLWRGWIMGCARHVDACTALGPRVPSVCTP